MLAVDTNVLVRLLVRDDPEQTAIAGRLFADNEIWLAKTVLLEAEWVIRRVYRLEAAAIRAAFVKVIGTDNVLVEDEASVATALDLWAQGLDFADAIHLTSRQVGSTFVSFDEALVKRATRAGLAATLPY